MWCGGHDGHLFADDERSTAKCDKNLAHNDESNALAGLAEMNHKTNAENLKAQHGHGKIFESAGYADDDSENDRPEAGTNAIDVRHITGVGYGEAVNGLQVVVER
jgi:hypothetical protein